MSAPHPLRAYRKERGLKLRQIADKVEVSAVYIHQIETWKKSPSFDLLRRLCQATGLPAEAFNSQARHDAGA